MANVKVHEEIKFVWRCPKCRCLNTSEPGVNVTCKSCEKRFKATM